MKKIFSVIILVCLVLPLSAKARQMRAIAVRTYPHDVSSFTQGLFFHNGVLYESVGQYGSSAIMKTDLKSGRQTQREDLHRRYFAEGSCSLNGVIYTLTWQEGTCFVYDPESLETISSFRYYGEGWGLTTDGKSLISSDGSATLIWRDTDTFKELSSKTVTLNGKALSLLNELEWIDGKIWANVYGSNNIVVIDPETAQVEQVIDCSALPSFPKREIENVLNGIAADPATGKIYVTGKLWPTLYEIRVQAK